MRAGRIAVAVLAALASCLQAPGRRVSESDHDTAVDVVGIDPWGQDAATDAAGEEAAGQDAAADAAGEEAAGPDAAADTELAGPDEAADVVPDQGFPEPAGEGVAEPGVSDGPWDEPDPASEPVAEQGLDIADVTGPEDASAEVASDVPYLPDDCHPSWNCGEWSACSCPGKQTRTCTDENKCGVETGKPPEVNNCSTCGNGVCDCGETFATCPSDGCVAACGGTKCPVVSGYKVSCNAKQACEYTGGPGGAMVYVPTAAYWMGANHDGTGECASSNSLDKSSLPDELPCREVTVQGFLIDRTEVTVAEYAGWMGAGGKGCLVANDKNVCEETGEASKCTPSGGLGCNYTVIDNKAHPVNCVNWCDMKAYCLSVGKRLCTEAEWELAARGTKGGLYPWGNENASCVLAVMSEGSSGCGANSTSKVGSKSPDGDSPYGVQDMAGNVSEWVEDNYHGSYAGAPSDGSAWVDSPPTAHRVFRGGSFDSSSTYLRASSRQHDSLTASDNVIGGRCCKSL